MRTSTRQDWIAAGALLGGLFASYAVPAATTGHSFARATAAMTIGALVALAVARNPFTFAPRIRTAFVLLVLLALWYVSTRLWALDPAGSMVESSRVSAFVLMAWAAHTCVLGTGARRLVLGGIGAAAAFIAVPPLVDLVRDGVPTERLPGELGYWNASAIVAMCLVPIAVALAGTARRRWVIASALLIPLAGVVAVASASRGALVALVVGLLFQAVLDPDYRGGLPRAGVACLSIGIIVFGLASERLDPSIAIGGSVLVAGVGFSLIRARRTRRERRLALADSNAAHQPREPQPPLRLPGGVRLAGGLIFGVLGVLLVALVVSANREQIQEAGDDTAPAAARLATTGDSNRTAWWEMGVDIWQRSPIIGEGGGAFALKDFPEVRITPDHVHSMPLEVLLETGIIGFLLLAAAGIQFLRVLRRGHRSTERALAGAIAALLLAQSMVDWTLSFPQITALLALAGPLAVQPPPDPLDDPVGDRLPAWAPIAMLCSLAAATMVALVPMLAALLADQGAERLDAGKPREAATLFAESMQLVPALDTLTLRVVSLQGAGREQEARQVLRETEQVWITRIDGLRLAEDLLDDDPEFGPRIDQLVATYEQSRAENP